VCFGAVLGLTNEPSQSASTLALNSNQPPLISVTSPASESSYPDGAAIPFSATASDPDGTVRCARSHCELVVFPTTRSATNGSATACVNHRSVVRSSVHRTASITVSASAGDDGTIARVDFYANETLIATTTTSPYSFSWSGVDAGSYRLPRSLATTLATRRPRQLETSS
jgi:hypothetical protein